MSQLKAGVIGAGAFGAHHARKYAAEPRVQLIGVYDADSARAEAITNETGGKAAASLEALIDSVDVLTIATPAVTHGALARKALQAGKHVLVEKPLAVSNANAAELVKLSTEKKLVLACGHQERLVFEAMGLLDAPERPTRIECVREGPWTGRCGDVSVTLDLMVHDIDLALTLMGGAHRVSARGSRKHGRPADEMTAIVSLEGGRAKLTASRAAAERARTMRIVYPSGEVAIDFIARTFENSANFKLNENFADTPPGRDPLGANVSRFIDAVTGKAARPAVNGAEGEAALALALRIDKAADFPSLAESEHAPLH
jgi:predicted dehydrogenase